MNITGWHIDGFGIFHDQRVVLPGRLILFQGANEAGKSTLLGFLRAILFGFPRANAKDPSYPPLNGGVHGGRIDLQTKDGVDWSVARKPGPGGGRVTVTGPDGAVYDKTMLDQLLGTVSYEAYRDILAFGLSELQSFESLAGTHVASAIHGAGLGTAMMALPRAQKRLQQDMEDLFRAKGNKKINQLVQSLAEIRKKIQAASEEVVRYDDLWDRFALEEKEIQRVLKQLTVHRCDHETYEVLARLWPEWVALREHEAALAGVDLTLSTFPEEGLSCLDQLAETRSRHRKDVSDATGRLQALANRRAALTVDPVFIDGAPEINRLLESRAIFAKALEQQPLLELERTRISQELNRLIERLGTDWDEVRLRKADRSLFTRDAIRRHRDLLAAAERNLASAQQRVAERKAALDKAAFQRRVAEKECEAKGPAPIARDQVRVVRLQQGRDHFSETLSRRAQVREALIALRSEAAQEEMAATAPLHRWPLPAVMLIGVAAAIAGGYAGAWKEAVLLLLVTALAAWAVWTGQRQRRQNQLHRQEARRWQQRQLEALEADCRGHDNVVRAYRRLAEDLIGPAVMEGGSDNELLQAVDRFLSMLHKETARAAEIRGVRERLDERKAHETLAAADLDAARAEHRQTAGALDEERTAWRQWLHRQGFSEHLSPETAMEALETVEKALVLMQRRETCLEDLAAGRRVVETYVSLATPLLSRAGMPEGSPGDLPGAVDVLVARLEEMKGNQRELGEVERQIAEHNRRLAAATAALGETELAITDLLRHGAVKDETAFRRKAEQAAAFRSHRNAADLAARSMRNISGTFDIEQLKERLNRLSMAEINAGAATAQDALREAERTLDAHYRRRAELKQQIDALSSSEDLLTLRSREETLLADLEEAAREWSRYALAAALLEQAQEVFEKKHQPRILQDAGAFFRCMTGGRYPSVMAPMGEKTLAVVDAAGRRVSPADLSRGTVEQLYLSVRFGYMRHQAQHSDPLPVVFDDILVNFDPGRARKAAEAICRLSQDRQVLVFTCHPETVSLFLDTDDQIPVVTLSAGRILPPGVRAGDKREDLP